ncbi:protein shank isoform X5 [Lucilia cuprina]|uniref:protein shank isoform X5 n=1 Tax=Lucilia cuprina TaxID=7375 RepID=UPI001F07107B|nr:protein shank isoform X5 [Lucilia cuprina]
MDNSSGPGFDDEPPPEPRDGWLLVRIHVPELNVYKCLQFPSDKLVWDVKQQVLASLPKVAFWFKELKESFNYGLFCPPSNGKAGKFLDEERRLGDYPFNGPVGYLELKYKRRVYKMLNLDERQLKALHTRANLRRFLECINGGHVEKIAKMCAKGLDPNFHCPESGETPLTVATGAKKPNKLLIALVNGGALLDYRTKDGTTALHRAVEKDSLEAVTTLLELGASPNYKDGRGITPLYISITRKCEPKITESLLHDHASLGTQDNQGWNEVHQACRHGLVQHLEHLLFYGADMDGRNASGNTPLHVCAVNNQEACARMLLFRGAQRGALNYANQTPYQVAVIAGNLELAEIIQNYKTEDVDKSLGDTSDIISDSSGVGTNSDSAACSIGHPSTTVVCMEPYAGNSVGHIRLQVGDVIEVVGSTDCGLLEGYVRGTNQSGFFPAECVQEVNLRQKNITNVATANPNQSPYQHSPAASSVHQGSPQLSLGGSSGIGGMGSMGGTLPRPNLMHHQSPSLSVNSNGSTQALNNGHHMGMNDNTMKMAGGGGGGNHHQIGQYSSATAPRVKKSAFNEPRTVVLHRAKRGFGFILRGAKASSQLMQLKPSDRFPALQYLDDVDPGGVADMAGLKPGDFLLAINGEDVRAASHEKVVEMIRSAGALVSMTVISPQFPNQMQATPQYMPTHHLSSGPSTPQTSHRQCATLPRKMSLGPNAAGGERQGRPAPLPPRRDPKTTLSVGRARAKSMVAGLENGGEKEEEDIPHTKSSSVESIVTPTPTHPGTPVQLRTASIKARPTSSRITAAELEELFQRQQGEAVDGSNRYSTMMTTSRFQSGTDSGAATPPANNSSPLKGPLVYGSVAEMKRKTKAKNGTLRGKPCAIPTVGAGARDLKRFHSTPDLNATAGGSSSSIWTPNVGKGHHSQDDVATLHASMSRLNTLPPPTHPPPPPPVVGQVVKVETRQSSEYESTLSLQQKLKKRVENDAVTAGAIDGVQSSFKPSANAKIYASPQELIAWKLRQNQENRQTNQQQQQQQQNSQQHYNSNQALGFTQSTQMQQQQQQLPPPPPPQQLQQQQIQNQQTQQISQYAQPSTLTRTNSNTNSSTSSSANATGQYAVSQTALNGGIINHATQVNSTSNNNNITNSNNNGITATTANVAAMSGPAPPIPEPDYSLSESDGEDENSILVARNTKLNEKIALIDVPETSGNSQASASSSGSGSASISHSLSVDEIQRIRSNLKTSKSQPNGFDKNDADNKSSSSSPPTNENETAKNDNDVVNNNNNNNNNNEEEGDNSSSGVSSDQEVLAASANTGEAAAPKSTDTIKKKPSVTINEEPKTIPDQGKDETDATKLPKITNSTTTTTATMPPMQTAAGKQGNGQQQQHLETTAKSTPPSQHRSLQITIATTAANNTTNNTTNNSSATSNNLPATTKTSVANAKAAFEAKANAPTTVTSAIPNIPTTVTVKQMVQQQHAPVIQQQQQQMSVGKGPKTLLAQTQQVVAKAQPSVAGRLAQQQQQQPQPHMNPNQKLLATQQQILMQQQQQQQQIAHQQHLQQILKAKAAAAAGAANTAAIVAKQQQQMAANKANTLLPTQDSQEEQRSDDDGDLSPSPPAKGFQRHNSLTRKQAAAIAMQRATRSAAVSLVQLPPPIEADSDTEMSLISNSKTSVAGGVAATSVQDNDDALVTENIVLAPPPQFCDCNDIKHAPQLQQPQQQPTMPQQHQMHLQQQQTLQQQRLHQQQQQLSLQQQQAPQQQQQHHHLQQQQHQQQQLQYQQYQQHLHQQQLQAAMQLQMQQQQHPHNMMQQHYVTGSGNVATAAAGANTAAAGNMGTLGRVRIVGTLPKTNHHRLH